MPDIPHQNKEPLDASTLDPATISGLSFDVFRDPENLRVLEQYVTKVAYGRYHEDARATEEAIREVLSKLDIGQADTQRADILDELAFFARYGRLSTLPEMDLRDLFEHHVLIALKNEVDVVEWLDDALISLAGASSLQKILGAAVSGFRNNDERIGTTDIDRGARGMVSPLVRNWLMEYEQYAVSEKPRGAFEQSLFFAKSPNVKKLSPEDHSLLQKVVQMFDSLLFPEKNQGIAERVPTEEVIEERVLPSPVERVVETVIPSASPSERGASTSTVPENLTPALSLQEREQRFRTSVDRERGRMSAAGAVTAVALRDLLAPASGARTDAATIAAALELLAEQKTLEQTLTAQDIRPLFTNFINTNERSAEFQEAYRIAPTSPKIMRLFLSWALEDRSGLSENDAAQVAVRIANILRRQGNDKYLRMAYMDSTTGTFHWAT